MGLRIPTVLRVVVTLPLSLVLAGGLLAYTYTYTDSTGQSGSWSGPDPLPTPSRLYLQESRPLPIQPSVELTVCPEGPPRCSFARIQDAIDAAPYTPPFNEWSERELPSMPFIRIAPGLYRENLVILKSVFLQGEDPDRTVVQGQLSATPSPFALFIAGSFGIGVGTTGLTIQGGAQIIGIVGGMIYDNRFLPHPDTGLSGMLVSGQLNLWIFQNRFVGGNPFNRGFSAVDLSFGFFSEGILGRRDSLILEENTFTGVSSRPRASAGPAIAIAGARFVRLEKNRIFANEDVGLEFNDVQVGKIVDNVIEENLQGIDASGSALVLRNNWVHRNRGDGVILREGSYSFEGNVLSGNGEAGLVLASLGPDIPRWWIEGNTIVRNDIGLLLSPSAPLEGLECVDNLIRENAFADYVIGSSPSEELRNRCEP